MEVQAARLSGGAQ